MSMQAFMLNLSVVGHVRVNQIPLCGGGGVGGSDTKYINFQIPQY